MPAFFFLNFHWQPEPTCDVSHFEEDKYEISNYKFAKKKYYGQV